MMFVWPLKTTVVAQAVPIVTRVGLSVFVFLVLRSTLFIACRTMSLLLVGTMWLTRLSCMFGLFGEMLNFSFSLLWKTVFSFLLNQVGRITFRNWNQRSTGWPKSKVADSNGTFVYIIISCLFTIFKINVHLPNTFWLYQHGVKNVPFQFYSHLLLTTIKRNTL